MTGLRLAFAATVLTAAFLAALSGTASAQNRCAVADHADAELALRNAPDGAVVARIGNGAWVRVLERSEDENGNGWVLVRRRDASPVTGWVSGAHLSCY